MKVMNFRQLLFWWFLSLLVSKSSSVRECLKSGFSKYKVSWQKVPRSTSGLLWEKYISKFAVQREIKHSHLLSSVKTGVLDVQPEFQFMTSIFYFFRKFIPALAGFQSEHAVEIPFMLTTIAKILARGPKRLRIGGVWGCSSNWKCSGEGFSWVSRVRHHEISKLRRVRLWWFVPNLIHFRPRPAAPRG